MRKRCAVPLRTRWMVRSSQAGWCRPRSGGGRDSKALELLYETTMFGCFHVPCGSTDRFPVPRIRGGSRTHPLCRRHRRVSWVPLNTGDRILSWGRSCWRSTEGGCFFSWGPRAVTAAPAGACGRSDLAIRPLQNASCDPPGLPVPEPKIDPDGRRMPRMPLLRNGWRPTDGFLQLMIPRTALVVEICIIEMPWSCWPV